MSNTEHRRCQRLIRISPFPNSAWAFPELACSLDKFNEELGGWERAEPVRWGLQCVQQFSREHILLWLPCRSCCQRSGELPSHEQMLSCVREGLAWSPLSAAIPLKQVLIQFGRHWVQLCVAKTAFQAIPANQIQAETGTGLIIPSLCLTQCSFQYSRSQTAWETLDYQYSLGSGLKSLSNSHVSWGAWRRMFVSRGLSTDEGKKVQFLLLWKATELVTQK